MLWANVGWMLMATAGSMEMGWLKWSTKSFGERDSLAILQILNHSFKQAFSFKFWDTNLVGLPASSGESDFLLPMSDKPFENKSAVQMQMANALPSETTGLSHTVNPDKLNQLTLNEGTVLWQCKLVK